MQEKKNRTGLWIALVVVVAAAFLVYTLFFKSDNSAPLVSPEGGTAGSSSVGQEGLALAAELDAVKIDTSIFGRIYFQSLKSKTVSITPEFIGRYNPFAPVGGSNILKVSPTPAKTVKK